jgi:hypothetical protein
MPADRANQPGACEKMRKAGGTLTPRQSHQEAAVAAERPNDRQGAGFADFLNAVAVMKQAAALVGKDGVTVGLCTKVHEGAGDRFTPEMGPGGLAATAFVSAKRIG